MEAVTEEDRRRYLGLLAEPAEPEAVELALALLDRGVPARDVLLDLVAPGQARVGELWATAEWSVAQEHAATHISDRVVAAVATRTSAAPAPRGTVVVACVDGEWHALPARLLAEVIRLDGWRVRFLGASVPTSHLIAYLHQHGPDAVAVSCSLPTRLPAAQRVIGAAREAGYPVLAGGRGFGPGARWARRLGADRVARDAAGAVRELAQWPPPSSTPLDFQPTYLIDDEHTLIGKRRAELIDGGMRRLGTAFPPLRDYTSAQYASTVDDLGHIVDFLVASLFVDDVVLFTEFIDWLGMVLTARRVPMSSVDLVLAGYQEMLYDFPRALDHLRAGRSRT